MFRFSSPPRREDMVSVVQNYTYDDGCEPCGTDTFMREPFVVQFSPTQAGEVTGGKKVGSNLLLRK